MTESLDQRALRIVREMQFDRLGLSSDNAEQAQQEPVAWQPIETAPKNGTAILILSGGWATVGSWNGAVWKVSAPGYPQYPSDEQPEKWKPIVYEDAAPQQDSLDGKRLDWMELNVSAIRDIGWLGGSLRLAIDAAMREGGK